MAPPGEEERPDSEEIEAEEEGGPIKPFLEHLEDLRWVLIKSVVGTGLGMLLCLIAANYIINILEWPLERADQYREVKGQEVAFFLGTNVWAKFKPGVPGIGALEFGSNQVAAFEFVAVSNNGAQLLALQPVTNAARLEMVKSRQTMLSIFGPVGGFWVAFQVALYGGILLAAPYLIFVIGHFVLPALRINEKKYALQGFAVGTLLFMTGVAFCYFVLMPLALRASYSYSEWLGFSAEQWRAEEYISFVCKFMLGMGLGFEMPVVILTLVKIGILDYAKLKSMRRYMIVVNLVLGAVLTTPEVVTQVLMFLPLQFLYEVSVWIAWWWERKERREKQARKT